MTPMDDLGGRYSRSDSTVSRAEPIAIVGLACHYPGAANSRELWENILARRQQFRRVPDQRMPLADYYSADSKAPDKTYGQKGAFIDGFSFDRQKFRIPATTFESTDIVHWLALDVANQALEDVNCLDIERYKARTTVIVGNTLTGEVTRANTLRGRWPFVSRSMRTTPSFQQLPLDIAKQLEDEVRAEFTSKFPAATEDSLAGSLSNTIAGRICNHFDFGGGGYTVDGACASSLLAIYTAANALTNNDADMAVAGGVDVSMDPFEVVGFAKTRALSPDHMRVYDARANGFIPGEGCGFVVLKRLSDAQQDGDSIYALLRGWGISTDGKGALTAPSIAGQAEALRRAYARAEVSLSEVAFVEGHGTGTPVGDAVELSAVSEVLCCEHLDQQATCGITSIKSIIGHTKAAAGVAALIKAAIAVDRRVLPPLAACEQPAPIFKQQARNLYPLQHGCIADSSQQTLGLCAGVSAMGFGGINAHVVLESYGKPLEQLTGSLSDEALLASWQSTEAFPLSGVSIQELVEEVRSLQQLSQGISQAELVDLSAFTAAKLAPDWRVRAVLIADSPEHLLKQCSELLKLLEDPQVQMPFHQSGIFAGVASEDAPRVGFVFPGQGSQMLGMAKGLLARGLHLQGVLSSDDTAALSGVLSSMHPHMDRLTEAATLENCSQQLAATEVAQPAIVLASLAWQGMLRELGVRPHAVAGFSLGELSALAAAEVLPATDALKLAALRGRIMAQASEHGSEGQMLALACSVEGATSMLRNIKGYITIANINSPSQVVVSCDSEAAVALSEKSLQAGILCRRLNVSCGFHSELVAAAAAELEKAVEAQQLKAQPPAVHLVSSVQDSDLSALPAHLARHARESVDYMRMAKEMQASCDILLEVGPGRVLSGLTAAICGDSLPCLPMEPHAHSYAALQAAVAQLWLRGAAIRWQALFRQRLVRPFLAAEERSFIVNPCERDTPTLLLDAQPLANGDGLRGSLRGSLSSLRSRSLLHADHGLAAITAALAQSAFDITGFPRSAITAASRLLDDLNLDSIKAGDLIAISSRQHGVADRIDVSQYANARLQDIAAAIAQAAQERESPELERIASSRSAEQPAPDLQWVRDFRWQYSSFPHGAADHAGQARFQGSRTLLLMREDQAFDVLALVELLQEHGGHVKVHPWNAAKTVPASQLSWCTHIIAALNVRGALAGCEANLPEAVAMLHSLVQVVTRPGPALAQLTLLLFLEPDIAATQTLPAAAFAKALHMENPGIQLRTVSMPRCLMQPAWAETVFQDMATADQVLDILYDEQLNRFRPMAELMQPAQYPARTHHLGRDDVVLVTGGAKGITAECALAWAKTSEASWALVGSSAAMPGDASEVDLTLRRFAEAGVQARYFSCDITDAAAVSALLQDVRGSMGAVSALLHGAGRNVVRRARNVSIAEALEEMSPKLLGAQHILQGMQECPPQIVVALTSIIGVTGMPGNAWYAFANAALNASVAHFALQHSRTVAVCLAFGVWDEVGMGARMGSVQQLRQMGVGAIAPSEGVLRFVRHCTHDADEQQVIIVARLAGLPTWPVSSHPRISMRFIDKIAAYQPGVEIVSRTELDSQRDTFLRDHTFKGSMLFPAVFGLEAMAQAAAAAVGQPLDIQQISDVSLRQAIIVPREGLLIEVRACVRESNLSSSKTLVDCSIAAENSGFAANHFAATFCMTTCHHSQQHDDEQPSVGCPASGCPQSPPTAADEDQQISSLYGGLLFQGPRFQGLSKVEELTHSSVRYTAMDVSRGLDAGQYLLGNPYQRDVALQALLLMKCHQEQLPVAIQEITFGLTSFQPGLRTVHAVDIGRQGADNVSDVVLANVAGRIVEQIVGLHGRVMSDRGPCFPVAEDLLQPGPSDQRRLRSLLMEAQPGMEHRVYLHLLPAISGAVKDARHTLEREAVFVATEDFLHQRPAEGDLTLEWEGEGKPVLKMSGKAIPLSISHQGPYLLLVLNTQAVGCDLEAIYERSPDAWSALLGPGSQKVMEDLCRQGDDRDVAGTRLWSAMEAVFKVSGDRHCSFNVRSFNGHAAILVAHGSKTLSVQTQTIQLARGPLRMVAIATCSSMPSGGVEAPGEGSADHYSWYQASMSTVGAGGAQAFTCTFMVPFAECSTPSGNVASAQVASWVGRVREMAIFPSSQNILAKLSAGQDALVTKETAIALLAPVPAFSTILASASLSWCSESAAAVLFQFSLVKGNGTATVVAEATQEFAWARIVGFSRIQPTPFPPFFAAALEALGSGADQGPSHVLTMSSAALPSSKELMALRVETTFVDGNSVGNIYFANYFSWARAVLEKWLASLLPSYHTDRGQAGEMVVASMHVKHLREAMPHDVLEVLLHAPLLSPDSQQMVFGVSFWRISIQLGRQKLAIGQQQASWQPSTAGGDWRGSLPSSLLAAIQEA